MKLLSLLDQMFARMETPRTPVHIGAFAIFDLPEGAPESFTRDLYEAISLLEYLPFPFDSVIAGGPSMLYWKQVQPDPTYHVRLSALPRPGSAKDLGALVERLHSTPLDMTKPLWELHLVEGLENNRFAVYFKAHHCAVDGMGAINFIKQWLTTDPEAPPGSGKSDPAGDADLASVFVTTTAKRTVEGVSAVGELVGKITSMARGANSSVRAALNTPRTPFNTRINRHKRLAVQVLSLPRLKAVATATGTTVNDVILACVGGACRHYLQDQDALPKNTLTASVPVGFERDPETTVNAASGFVAPLGTSTADPVERLIDISSSTSRSKAELLALSPNALEHYSVIGLLPIAFGQRAGYLQALPPLFNFTVSNVVLSKQPLYLSGAKLDILVPVSFLCDGYGLNVTLVGYTDKVVLGFLGCRDTVPHVQRLAQYTAEAFDELEAAVTP